MGIEVPPLGELAELSGVSQVATTSIEVPFYKEEMLSKFIEVWKAEFTPVLYKLKDFMPSGNFACPEDLLRMVEGLTEAQKVADVAVVQPSMEPKLAVAKLTLVKVLAKLQAKHTSLVENTEKIQKWLVQEVTKALSKKMDVVARVRELEDLMKTKGSPVPTPLAVPLLSEVEQGVEEKIS
ncbi:hypothetical protein R1flu_006607 [Riccia fluitans]|uniref:Uncharacterized protein n=1 Tax=Riccia fluitans TaxID=41844 RepID=A0ABD1YWQ5_9MARC